MLLILLVFVLMHKNRLKLKNIMPTKYLLVVGCFLILTLNDPTTQNDPRFF